MVDMKHPLIPPKWSLPVVNVGRHTGDQQGSLTNIGLNILQGMFNSINGLTPTIACTATVDTNVYTLTPFDVSPQFADYFDYTSFAFVAPGTSTGLITATVVPKTGVVATLKVYKTNGSAQATTNDITINLFYLLYYVSSLDSGNGGLVLK